MDCRGRPSDSLAMTFSCFVIARSETTKQSSQPARVFSARLRTCQILKLVQDDIISVVNLRFLWIAALTSFAVLDYSALCAPVIRSKILRIFSLISELEMLRVSGFALTLPKIRVLDFLLAQLCRSFGFASIRFELRSPD